MPITQALVTVDSKFKPEITLDMIPEGQVIIAPSSNNMDCYFAWVKLKGKWYIHCNFSGTSNLGHTSSEEPIYSETRFNHDGWVAMLPGDRSAPSNPLRVLDKKVKIAES